MKKIPTLFMRNYETDYLVRDEVTHGCEWVIAGEGIGSVKFDGMACMIRDGTPFRRYDAKPGRTPPPEFEPADNSDPVSGHWPGWVPVGDGPEDRWFRDVRDRAKAQGLWQYFSEGTFECVGPKVQGNPYGLTEHTFIKHGSRHLPDAPRSFVCLRVYLSIKCPGIEGIVWHHPDGRMSKIKRRDFGLRWPVS